MRRKRVRRLWVAYPIPHDLQALIARKHFSILLLAHLLHTTSRILTYRLSGFYRLTDELRNQIIDIVTHPKKYRKFKPLLSVKRAMLRYHVGIRPLAVSIHEDPNRFRFILDGYESPGGVTQVKHYHKRILEIYHARSPQLQEWVHLSRKKKLTQADRKRLRYLYHSHFKREWNQ